MERALDPLELEEMICESSCGCWGFNPDPLEEQMVLLTAEPSLQSIHTYGANIYGAGISSVCVLLSLVNE